MKDTNSFFALSWEKCLIDQHKGSNNSSRKERRGVWRECQKLVTGSLPILPEGSPSISTSKKTLWVTFGSAWAWPGSCTRQRVAQIATRIERERIIVARGDTCELGE